MPTNKTESEEARRTRAAQLPLSLGASYASVNLTWQDAAAYLRNQGHHAAADALDPPITITTADTGNVTSDTAYVNEKDLQPVSEEGLRPVGEYLEVELLSMVEMTKHLFEATVISLGNNVWDVEVGTAVVFTDYFEVENRIFVRHKHIIATRG